MVASTLLTLVSLSYATFLLPCLSLLQLAALHAQRISACF